MNIQFLADKPQLPMIELESSIRPRCLTLKDICLTKIALFLNEENKNEIGSIDKNKIKEIKTIREIQLFQNTLMRPLTEQAKFLCSKRTIEMMSDENVWTVEENNEDAFDRKVKKNLLIFHENRKEIKDILVNNAKNDFFKNMFFSDTDQLKIDYLSVDYLAEKYIAYHKAKDLLIFAKAICLAIEQTESEALEEEGVQIEEAEEQEVAVGQPKLPDDVKKILKGSNPKAISACLNDESNKLFLQKITYLDLSLEDLKIDENCKMFFLPKEIGLLSNLEELYLFGNNIEFLPIEIASCKKLRVLDLSSNRLNFLFEEINCLKGLKDLCLYSNQLEFLPDGIGECVALENLDLGHNQIKQLPESIGKCRALSRLNLSFNQLESLPDSIAECTGLTSLSVSNNKLTALPDQIGSCNQLKIFLLSSNNIAFFPKSIINLNELEVFHFFYNKSLENNLFSISSSNLCEKNEVQKFLKSLM